MPDTKRLYRFELANDSGRRAGGLFNAIYEIGMPESKPVHIECLFRNLKSHACSEPCVFWFTDEGLVEFTDALVYAMQVVSEYGWSLVMATRPYAQEPDSILYKDRHQVAFRETGERSDYEEITPYGLNVLVDGLMECMEP